MRDTVLLAMAEVRRIADVLERTVADDLWPLPNTPRDPLHQVAGSPAPGADGPVTLPGVDGPVRAWRLPPARQGAERAEGRRDDARRGHGGRRGAGREVHPALVHGHPRAAQELRDHQGGAGRRLEGGMGFDGSSITGFNAIEESDMIALPTGHVRDPPLPPQERRSRACSATSRCRGRALRGRPALRDAAALERAKGMGYDHFYLGPELEYLLPRLRRHRGARQAATSTSPRSTRRATCAATGAGARGDGWRRRSTRTTRPGRPSTRSTCASPTAWRWPTTS